VGDERSVEVVVEQLSLSPEWVARLTHLSTGSPLVATARLGGTPERMHFAANVVAPDLSTQPIAIRGRVLQRPTGFAVENARVTLAGNRLRGAADVSGRVLKLSLDVLRIEPALLRHLWPALDPEWPIQATLTAAGTQTGIDVVLIARAGPSTTAIYGRIDPRARHAVGVGWLDSWDVGVVRRVDTENRVSAQLHFDGWLAGGGIVGKARIRDGIGTLRDAQFFSGRADVLFTGREFRVMHAQIEIPGARVSGHGDGSLRGDLALGYEVLVTHPFRLKRVPATLRVVLGIAQGIFPGRVVEGKLTKRPNEPFHNAFHLVPPGRNQLRIIFRFLRTGRLRTVEEQ
jgi:hypothetical protein